jgi:hypothetical protein
MDKDRKTESAHKRKGILKDSERQDSSDTTLSPDDGALRRAIESVRTLAQNALNRMRSKAVHPPEKK